MLVKNVKSYDTNKRSKLGSKDYRAESLRRFEATLKGTGAKSVSEVKYNSEIDIEFNFFDIKWILSVKIGDTPSIVMKAFMQYDQHKEESNLTHGMIVFFPEETRLVKPLQEEVTKAVREKNVPA